MSNNEPMYVVQPEHHGFILPLLDSRFLLDNKNDRKLSTREELYRDLIVNLEIYASEKDLEIIKSNPAFMNAKLECLLSESISNQINILMRELMHSDEVLRYQLMTKVLETLIELNRMIMKREAHMYSSKLVYGYKLNEGSDGEYKKGMLQADGLHQFIIQLLALKMHGENYEYLNKEEELSYQALWAAAQMYDLKLEPGSDVDKELKRISTTISNDEKYQALLEKAKAILNLDDAQEFIMFTDIMRLSAAYYLMPVIDVNDYQKTVKFIEQAISKDKWDILEKFCNSEWSNNTVRELTRINSLRGLHQ